MNQRRRLAREQKPGRVTEAALAQQNGSFLLNKNKYLLFISANQEYRLSSSYHHRLTHTESVEDLCYKALRTLCFHMHTKQHTDRQAAGEVLLRKISRIEPRRPLLADCARILQNRCRELHSVYQLRSNTHTQTHRLFLWDSVKTCKYN